MTSSSKVSETEGAGKVMLAIAGGLIEDEIEPAMRPLMGKPSISDFLPYNHNIL